MSGSGERPIPAFKDLLTVRRIVGMIIDDFEYCSASDLEDCVRFLKAEADKLFELREVVERAYTRSLLAEQLRGCP